MNKPISSVVEAAITAVSQAKLANEVSKGNRATYIRYAAENNIKIVHIFNKERPKGGLTVAFRKTMPHQASTNMVEVAVATCSLADNFSRKIGTHLALQSFEEGNTIRLPLSYGYPEEDLNKTVIEFFSNTAYAY
jgi:hypothetical protein